MNLFFIGKTGRGKTQLARKLGEKYSKHFWVINCAEFTNGHEVSRLLGSPPGYIGHSESSLIKEKADQSNRWTIVFDEIEKAHPKLYNILLSLLDTGTLTDNSGNEIDLTDSIFIMTSNCGLKDLAEVAHFTSGPWCWMSSPRGRRRTRSQWDEIYQAGTYSDRRTLQPLRLA